MRKLPAKSTFHDYWDEANETSWIRMSGYALTTEKDTDVAIETSNSKVHDYVIFGPIWKNMYTRVKRFVRRVHLDKGCWSS